MTTSAARVRYAAGVTAPPQAPPLGVRLLARILAVAVRLLGATWRVESTCPPEVDQALASGAVVYAFWHGEQLPLAWLHRDRQIVGMASRSRDGELLARTITALGYGTIRGSSSRGGARALRQAIRQMRSLDMSMALAVDGPRGPRHEPHAGAVALALAVKRPLVMVACSARPALRLKTWDRFVIPWPFARLRVVYGLAAPPGERQRVEAGRVALADGLLELGDRALRDASSP